MFVVVGGARGFGGCRPKANAAPWRAALLLLWWYCDCDCEEVVVSALATELALDTGAWFAGMSACERRPYCQRRNRVAGATSIMRC